MKNPHSTPFPLTNCPRLVAGCVLAVVLAGTSRSQDAASAGGTPVVAPEALLTTPVEGLGNTKATREILAVKGQPFGRALHVHIGARASESNATQLNLRTDVPVAKGDALLASFSVRGVSASGQDRAQMEFLFEQATHPWTKSVTHRATTASQPDSWKRILVPFVSRDTYPAGEAMISVRFAFGPQSLELGGLSVVNYAGERTLDELRSWAAEQNPIGNVTVTVDLQETRQTLEGFGGNFAQPRYGSDEPMDAVGRHNLEHLRVVHARVGIPLNHWTPEKGVYRNDGPARAALLQMQIMAVRNIPITGSIWEGPLWMLPGRPEQPRVLPRDRYDDCIEAIAQFLVTARDAYGATVDYVSFNEPDIGVNFRFSSVEMAEFIREAGPRFASLGLTTRFLTADTANGSRFADYATPLLEDRSIAPYLGPLAFHGWDALSAPKSAYTAIAALGRTYGKPVWCTEAGHDSALWRATDPWSSWDNALRTAHAYARTLRLSGASRMDYWTYQDNYPLVSKSGSEPFPVWHVLHQMEQALPAGSRVATASVRHDDLEILPTVGPGPGQFSLLLVNPTGPGQATVGGLPGGAGLSVVQSDREAQARVIAAGARTDRAGHVTVTLPPRSVTTLLGSRDAP